MDTDTIDRLFLELSQFTKATTAKEMRMQEALERANDICRSMWNVAVRNGEKTDWKALLTQIEERLQEQHAILHPPTKEAR